ncbi:MAG: M48 family metallopeptidase [Coprococcus sp.]|nr:M48 family metallopeptidase [Coprococcus sp.]
MLTECYVEQNGERICIQVVRSSRRSVALEVRPDGTVFARIPHNFPDQELKEFCRKHERWILKKYGQTKRRTDAPASERIPKTDQLSLEEIEKIKSKFSERVSHYCSVMEVSAGRITIRNQKTRWGSCSAKGNLNFNYKLCYLPEELLDYVVVHELAHRRHMNHSQLFWEEVEKYCPGYRECRRRLKEYQSV